MLFDFSSELFIAFVTSNANMEKDGGFYAEIPSKNLKSQFINYVSPMYLPNSGGMLVVPPVRSKIIVARINDTSESGFYYMGSIAGQDNRFPDNGGTLGFTTVPQQEIYNNKGIPQSVMLTNQFDAGYYVYRLKDDEKLNFNSRVELKSEKGKVINLNDNPANDSIFIYNNLTEHILITGDGSNDHAPRNIQISGKGTISNQTANGDYKITVTDGREINIHNNSTGAYKPQGEGSEKYGNINVKSENKDINIVARGDESSLFIVTPKARIQIDDNGDIRIHANQGDINIDSPDGNINIKGVNLNMDFEQINIKASNNIAVHASNVASIKGDAQAAIDGGQVHLNSGNSASVNPIDGGVFEYQNTLYGD